MVAGTLKEIIKDIPDDTEVYVCCQGYSNYDFKNQQMHEDEDTFCIEHNGKVFITDACAVETENGETI